MSTSSRGDHLGAVPEEGTEDSSDSDSDTMSTTPRNKRDDLVNPYWIEDPDLGKGEVEYLSSAEILFWKDLLAKYLYPIDENKEEKVRNKYNNTNYFSIVILSMQSLLCKSIKTKNIKFVCFYDKYFF